MPRRWRVCGEWGGRGGRGGDDPTAAAACKAVAVFCIAMIAWPWSWSKKSWISEHTPLVSASTCFTRSELGNRLSDGSSGREAFLCNTRKPSAP
jgi:hypothetical protein